MKFPILLIRHTFFSLLVLVMIKPEINAQETVIFNQTVTWGWPINNTYGGNSFYWWHYASRGIENLGNMPATDWTIPANYWNGTIYLRYEVISQPTSVPFQIQMGIWQDGGAKESVSLVQAKVAGGNGSVLQTSLGSPSAWYVVYPTLDFTRPEDFDRIGLALWTNNASNRRGCLPMAQGWNNSAACADAITQKDNFFPMQARITVVAVAQGSTFSGWSNYTGGTAPPTPTYSVDFLNKLTNKVIPSTDEYSYSSNMSGAVSGNGQKLALVPGQDVYFRTKAVGATPASLVQFLDVPSKPAAPTFTYNSVSLRTTQTISNAYEYADLVSMAGAITGTGNYVSFALGTTKYFRSKATSGAFESNVQALLGSSSEPPSSGPEFVILNDIIDFPNATDTNGFYFFHYDPSMPSNWLSTYDYYNGQVYTRYEIVSQVSSEPVGLQFGIWQKLPPETGTLYENMEPTRTLNGPGSVATNNSRPSTWWKYNGGIDFAQMDKVWHFGINPYKVNSATSFTQIRSENTAVWNVRNTYWFPMKVRVTVVAVASGYTFSGWSNYPPPTVNQPPTPNYSYDTEVELTNKIVPATDEYSVDSIMSGAVSGTGSKITITPGQDLYFRTKAAGENPASDIQFLDIPGRPPAPAFTYDGVNQRTASTVSSNIEYSSSPSMTGAITGTGTYVSFPVGTTYYFRTKATPSTFKSDVQSLLGTAAAGTANCSEYLQHYWKFEENNLGTFLDYAGSLNASVAVSPARVTGAIDFAQYFNGLAEASIPDDGSFDWNANSSFSIEFWLNKSSACPAPTVVNQNVIIGRDDASTQLHWWAGVSCLDTGKINFNLLANNGSGQNLVSKSGVIDGNWHHIAIVRDGNLGTTSIYIDGARDTTISYTYTGNFASSVPVNIGWLNLNTKFHFDGSLDELALYNRAISASEIIGHYNGGSAVSYCTQTETAAKILPLGNSITFDAYNVDSRPVGDKISYRYPLFNLLNHANHQFDFVGSESGGSNYFSDTQNGGFPGIRDDQMVSLLNTGYNPIQSVQETNGPYLDSYLPDIILLHIGTNSVQESATDVQNILNEIDAYKTRTGKDTKVILARIINRQNYSQVTTTFNNNVATMAINRNDPDIYYVDMENGAGINYAADMTDDLHPNPTGYKKMAINWFNKLSEILPQKTYQPRIEVPPANTGIVNVAYNSKVFAIGNPAPVFSLTTAPPNMTINPQTGVISWTPTTAGSYSVSVLASNSQGSDTVSISLQITGGQSESTVGYTTIFANASGATNRRAQPVTMTEDGTISSISVYHHPGTGNMILGIYGSTNNLPGQLLAVTPVTPVSSTLDWQTVNLTTPVFVSQGTTIWLAWVFQNAVSLRYTAGTPGRANSSQTYSGGMPGTFGSSSISSSLYSIYATYSTGTSNPLPPDAPGSLTATTVSSSAINLTWADNSTNEDSFEIERSLTSGSGFSLIHTTAANATSFSNTGLNASTTYYYRVRAFNNQGYSAYTSVQQATTSSSGGSTATVGYTQIFASISGGNNRRAQPVTLTEDGTLSSISVYHLAGTGNMILAIYGTTGGKPGQLLGITPVTAVNSSDGWQTVNLTTPVFVSQGTTIWLAWVFQNTVSLRYTAGTPGRAHSSQIYAGGMPNPFGTSSLASSIYSIYATYTPSGNAPLPPIAPTGFTTDAVSTSQIDLSWADNSLNEEGFEIDRSLTSGSGYQIIQTTASNVTAFADTGLNPNQTYFYRVRAFNIQGPSAYTPEQQATTLNTGGGNLTVGYTDIFASISSGLNRRAQPVTMTETGTISSISIYHGGGSGNVILGIYNITSGLPGQRIAISLATPVNSTAGWQTVDLVTPVSVSQGTEIGLAWAFQNPIALRYTAGTPGRAQSSQTYLGGMPDPFGTSSVASSIYSIYANYTPALLKSSENESVNDHSVAEYEFDVYPTFVNSSFTIKVVVPEIEDVSIGIYNLLGIKLKDVVTGKLQKGENYFYIDDLSILYNKSSTEVLVVRLLLKNSVQTRKILLSNE